MRSRQVSLRAVALAHHAGIASSPGASRWWAIACSAATLSSIGVQLSSAVTARRGLGGAGRRLDHGEDLAAVDGVADRERRQRGRRCRRRARVTDGLHLHGADRRTAGRPPSPSAPSRTLMSTTEPACGLSMASWPGGTGSGRGGAALRRRAPRPSAAGLLVEELQRRLALRLRRGSMRLGEQRRARIAGAGTRDGPGWRAAGRRWSARRRCGTRRARAACGRRPSRTCPRNPTGRSAWRAADRTAAAAPARDSRRHRPARPDRTARGRR